MSPKDFTSSYIRKCSTYVASCIEFVTVASAHSRRSKLYPSRKIPSALKVYFVSLAILNTPLGCHSCGVRMPCILSLVMVHLHAQRNMQDAQGQACPKAHGRHQQRGQGICQPQSLRVYPCQAT